MASNFGLAIRNLLRLLTGQRMESADADAESGRVGMIETAESPTVEFLHRILIQADQDKGDEIRINPRQTPAIGWRVGSQWKTAEGAPADGLQPLVRRLKVMANLDLGDRTKAQQGSFVMMGMGSKRRYDLFIEPLGGGDEAARVVPSKTPA